MEIILDNDLLQSQNPAIEYGTFWQRLGALLIDSIVIGTITFPLTFYNIISWKSTIILVIASIIGLAYKPFMEYKYRATLGKMALNLIVANQQYEPANLMEILLRNIFHIVPTLVSLVISYSLFSSPEFKDVHSFIDYGALSQRQGMMNYIQMVIGFIFIADGIFLMTDDKKRALHDRIGKTFVIKKR